MSDAVTAESLISADMAAAVGREIARRVSFPVAVSDIRRWAIATYYPAEPPRRYWDGEDVVAPRDLNPFAWITADPPGRPAADHALDAIERALGIEGPGLRVGLNGGLDVEYGVALAPGDVVTSVRRLVSYREREGSLGQMLFTITEDEWTRQDGALVQRRLMTSIRYGR